MSRDPLARLGRRWLGLRLPRRTIRLRLTILYGGLFLLSGAALLAVTYVLVARQYTAPFFIKTSKAGGSAAVIHLPTSGLPAERFASAGVLAGRDVQVGPAALLGGGPGGRPPNPTEVLANASAQSRAALNQLLIQEAIALAIMALLSIWLGWLVAGRALRPLRTITNAAKEISASNLHRRLALTGPDDELQQLGNTFDGLLERLQASFDAQRQFVANASHELRTPLTLERTVVEVALADPAADADTLRRTCEQVLAANVQQERLIESLLTLSRSQRGLERHDPVDLAAVAAEAIEATEHGGLTVEASLGPARTSGDRHLIERLVANLVSNAVRHNRPRGRVELGTATRGQRSVITVANTGPTIHADEIERLFQPFQRLGSERTRGDGGLGLGLSIVRAIAQAHSAVLVAAPRPGGGLLVDISFPGAARS